MAHVAGILLDEVDDDVARRGVLAVDVDRRLEVKVGVDGPGMGDLPAPGLPSFGNDFVVGHGLVEVQVRVLLGAVKTRQLDSTFEDSARPGVLDSSEVSDHAQQRHRRRRDRASGELLGGESLALELEGHPVAVEVLREHRLLTPSGLERLSRIAARLSPHAIEVHLTNQAAGLRLSKRICALPRSPRIANVLSLRVGAGRRSSGSVLCEVGSNCRCTLQRGVRRRVHFKVVLHPFVNDRCLKHAVNDIAQGSIHKRFTGTIAS